MDSSFPGLYIFFKVDSNASACCVFVSCFISLPFLTLSMASLYKRVKTGSFGFAFKTAFKPVRSKMSSAFFSMPASFKAFLMSFNFCCISCTDISNSVFFSLSASIFSLNAGEAPSLLASASILARPPARAPLRRPPARPPPRPISTASSLSESPGALVEFPMPCSCTPPPFLRPEEPASELRFPLLFMPPLCTAALPGSANAASAISSLTSSPATAAMPATDFRCILAWSFAVLSNCCSILATLPRIFAAMVPA
mmetsp:Transcript_83200/g.152168  ORF Transcript_83200/g.152168 Transcript_83200/m.152168 type:complete len:255 (+) Transcript_83200:2089-2853(+)